MLITYSDLPPQIPRVLVREVRDVRVEVRRRRVEGGIYGGWRLGVDERAGEEGGEGEEGVEDKGEGEGEGEREGRRTMSCNATRRSRGDS